MEKILKARLQPAVRRHRVQVLSWQLAACWSLAALAGFGLRYGLREIGRVPSLPLSILAVLAGGAAVAMVLRHRSTASDYRAIAQKIEHRHPELKGLLLTAVQQEAPEGRVPGYLQQRLLDQAVAHSREHRWNTFVPWWSLGLAQIAHWAAFGLFLVALSGWWNGSPEDGKGGRGLVVTPGDTSIERGESLVVLARFGGPLPAGVTLVIHSSGESPRQIALVKSLADPVFGGGLPEVDHDLTYHLEYSGASTRDYKVSVFEHPRLVRADAVLTYPGYTHLTPKRIENTHRVSAVEGSRLELALQLNKPVASAALVAHDAKKTVIPLQVAVDQAIASLPEYSLLASQTYDLRLVDRDGRGNLPQSSPFVFTVLPDRPPELHVTSPRGDLRPSPIEEIGFAGTVLGDFGVSAYGLAYTLAGGEPKLVELGRSVPAGEKRTFAHTLRLEDLGVQPDQLVSWYVWADDIGPEGKPRRTTGDLFFAEIRPFDEIFRESKAMQGDDDPSGDSPNQGNESQRLTDLQKQIISATWKLQRDPAEPKYTDDTKVVSDSQKQALTQAGAGQEKAEDPRAIGLWTAVTQEMKQALTHLDQAGKAPTALAPALISEQAAYQALLRLQSRETQVARGRSGGRGRGSASQRQLDQLDLTQDQNRYETQTQAAPAQSPERREQLQVMNRLQELARRQQDVNDRLKEMQTALQEARTDQQREDLRRQLQRLQDEQQQVLADVDELQQRLDQQQNQSALNDQRRQLEQTRGEVQRAAEAAARGAVPEALASGTRAQRQFQQMRDDLHKQNSSQFADDLRDLRGKARELAEREEGVAQKLAPAAEGTERKQLSDSADGAPVAELDAQKKRMTELVDQAKQVSQQAENSEPLLAQKLYDTLRQLGQDDSGTAKEFQQELLTSGLLTNALNQRLTDPNATEGTKSLDLTSSLLQDGYLPQAREAEQRARAGIDELKDGVERAAESVIGDDTAALRLAQSELNAVTDQLKQEAAQAQASDAPGSQTGNKALEQLKSAVRLNPTSAEAQKNLGDALAQLGRQLEAAQHYEEARRIAAAGKESPDGRQDGSELLQQLTAEERKASDGQAAATVANNARSEAANGGNGGGGDPAGTGAPITGNGYGGWSDRLRDVEEIVDSPDLRNAVATAREHARLLRQDFKNNQRQPDWEKVQREVVKPLVEVRNQISDELARRGSKESLAPIDRDPVPNRYAESVRKYYEVLGKDK